MILIAKILIGVASVIYLWLCAAHLAFTFLTDKLYPNGKETIERMSGSGLMRVIVSEVFFWEL